MSDDTSQATKMPQAPLPLVRRAISKIRFFPKTHDFFSYFERNSETILRGAVLLDKMLRTEQNRSELLHELKAIEHEGDRITHEVIDLVRSTFLTPFDRTDIHTLVVRMDDILDVVFHIGNRLTLYKIKMVPKELLELSEITIKACEEIINAVKGLRNTKHIHEVQRHCLKINKLEKRADEVINTALEVIFSSGLDPIEVIKVKELAENLETATDKCKNVSNIIEGIILKHA